MRIASLYVPLSKWTDVNSTFEFVILRQTRLDPYKRVTVHQGLDHPWFEGIETA
jgi:hypothetical protein